MSKGVLLFANNNSNIDYIKQAVFCAKKIKEHLNLDVALCTDNPAYLISKYPFYKKYIDTVIEHTIKEAHQTRKFHDGTMSHRSLVWNNFTRSNAWDITPFEETIVMDTDVIVGNDLLKYCFESNEDFLMDKDVFDINPDRPEPYAYERISDRSIYMYWATIFYFKKNKTTKFYFDLVNHVKENWHFYRLIYQIPDKVYRNDFAFSIAVHILNGFQTRNWPNPLPGNIYFTNDKDVLHDFKDNKCTFLLDKRKWLGHYTLGSIKDCTVHVMNKFSLERAINEDFLNE